MNADPGTCNGCGKQILWVRNENGKAEPFDARPTRVLLPEPVPLNDAARQVAAQDPRAWFTLAHISHFILCPKSKDFRR